MLSKSWSTSKKRAALYRSAADLAEFCLQLFPLLVVHSDDYGRVDGDPETVKMVCDPGSPRPVEQFTAAIEHMIRLDLVIRYQAHGATWLQIVKFDAHQPGLLSKRSAAKTPAPPTDTESGSARPESALTQPNLTEPNSTQASGSALTNSAPFLAFPVVGPNGPTWTLSESQVDEWAELFPNLDVRVEMRKALAWVHANPGRRKTAKGMPKMLVGWLSRATDSGRGRATAPAVRAALGQPARDWSCRHVPPCPVGTSAFRCDQRTTLEAGRKAKAAS